MIRTVADLIAALHEYPADMVVLAGMGHDLLTVELDPTMEVYTGPPDDERLTRVLVVTYGDMPTIPVHFSPPDPA